VKKILYLECKTGAAGDMLMGALYGLLTEEQKVLFLEKLNAISEEVCVIPQEICKQGIGGVHMKVEINGEEEGIAHTHEHSHCAEHSHEEAHMHSHEDDHEHAHHHEGAQIHNHHHHEDEHAHVHHHGHHAHTSVASILEKISVLDMSDAVKRDAEGIYRNIAAAESKVHQTDMEQIHFHEVGSVDALIDVVGSCLALELLGVDEVQASPVCVGNGTVRCAHGILPVPAPATAEIIKGMPVYCSSFDGELLTPTGAAILKYFVETYTKEMHMEIEEIGYGFGTKDFAQLSCVRAFLGYQK
jgi:pyridinium-3,5-bisthiocarboxylic acid mononucleotide nickel chelatase